MNYEVYDGIKVAADFAVFDFISTGKNGAIRKRIAFTETEWKNVYNLAFGDIDDDGSINDSSVSNNGDRNKAVQMKEPGFIVWLSDYIWKNCLLLLKFTGMLMNDLFRL